MLVRKFRLCRWSPKKKSLIFQFFAKFHEVEEVKELAKKPSFASLKMLQIRGHYCGN